LALPVSTRTSERRNCGIGNAQFLGLGLAHGIERQHDTGSIAQGDRAAPILCRHLTPAQLLGMMHQHDRASGFLSQPLPPLGDGVDCLIATFPHGMAGHERVHDHDRDSPLPHRRRHLSKHALGNGEAVAILSCRAERLDKPAIDAKPVSAVVRHYAVKQAGSGHLPVQLVLRILKVVDPCRLRAARERLAKQRLPGCKRQRQSIALIVLLPVPPGAMIAVTSPLSSQCPSSHCRVGRDAGIGPAVGRCANGPARGRGIGNAAGYVLRLDISAKSMGAVALRMVIPPGLSDPGRDLGRRNVRKIGS
jgi:hypothetical protein